MALDNERPLQPVLLQPRAEVVDTYIRPRKEEPVAGNALRDLAQGLAKVSEPLNKWFDEEQRRKQAEDAIRGQAEFHRNNREGYNEAVAKGLIPAQSSKSFMEGYKRAQGEVAGEDLQRKFSLAYEQWDGKDSEDPNAYRDFVSGFIKENVATQDPYVLAGLLPKVRQMSENGNSRYVTDRSNRLVSRSVDTHTALVDNEVDGGNADGLRSGKGTDYSKLFANVMGIREKGLATGLSPDKLDPKIVDVVAAKAIEHRDPRILDFLNQQVPGTNYSFKDTPYGRKVRDETVTALEVMARKQIAEEKRLQEERDLKAHNDVKLRTIESIASDPNTPTPEALIAEGSKYDPEYRTKVNTWRGSILGDKGKSDPEQVTALNWEIVNGGGQEAVRKAMEKGVIKTAEELRAAMTLAKGYEEQKDKVDAILSRDSAKRILDTVKQRTLSALDLSSVFEPGGLSQQGLAASYDFKQSVIAWSSANPNASPVQLEEAIAKIGATILKGIGGGGGDAVTYTQPQGANPANPYLPQNGVAVPLPAPPATTPAAPPPATPVSPVAPPGPERRTEGPVPSGSPAEVWFAGKYTPQQQEALRQRAATEGKDFNAIVQEAYRRSNPEAANPMVAPPADDAGPYITADQIAFNPEAAQSVMDQIGAALNPQTQEAPTDPALQVTGDDGPVSDAVMALVATAFERALSQKGQPYTSKGNFALATIKDDPDAARLLDFIAGPESKGNYNAVFGNSNSTADLSKLTLNEVLKQQQASVKKGSPSSAVGRYQFLRKTLMGLKRKMGLTGEEKFTPELQDKLALQLLEQRGYSRFKSGKMGLQTFAANLAKEWASLPDPKTGRSFYAGDGLNKSLVTPGAVVDAIMGGRSLPAKPKRAAAKTTDI